MDFVAAWRASAPHFFFFFSFFLFVFVPSVHSAAARCREQTHSRLLWLLLHNGGDNLSIHSPSGKQAFKRFDSDSLERVHNVVLLSEGCVLRAALAHKTPGDNSKQERRRGA